MKELEELQRSKEGKWKLGIDPKYKYSVPLRTSTVYSVKAVYKKRILPLTAYSGVAVLTLDEGHMFRNDIIKREEGFVLFVIVERVVGTRL